MRPKVFEFGNQNPIKPSKFQSIIERQDLNDAIKAKELSP